MQLNRVMRPITQPLHCPMRLLCTHNGSTRNPLSTYDSIPNTGAVARDHLANERTFLAWARTGLAFIAGGAGLYAAVQFTEDSHSYPFTLQNTVVPASAFMILNGIIITKFSFRRYLDVKDMLQEGQFLALNRNAISGLLRMTGSCSLLVGICLIIPQLYDNLADKLIQDKS